MTKKYILLVEDDNADAEMTIDVLRKHSYADNLVRAKDGEEALQFLRHQGAYVDCQLPLPNVILLDINMPKLTGVEVLRAIRNDDQLKKLPVVLLTSSQEDGDLIESHNLNVNAYIIKPVDIDHFEHSIKELGIFWHDINFPPKE